MKKIINLMLLATSGIILASCFGSGNTEKGGDDDSLNTEPTVASKITKEDMLQAWTNQVGYAEMEIDAPEAYLFYDIDKDGTDEVLMTGSGFKAVFLNQNGVLTALVQCFGEYEDLSVTAEGDVVHFQESGMSTEVFTIDYYRLVDSNLSYIFTYETSFEDPDNEESTLLQHYSVSSEEGSKELTVDESEEYFPKTPDRNITGLEGWKEF